MFVVVKSDIDRKQIPKLWWGDGETSATRSFLPKSRNQELDLGWWPKVAPRWNVIHGMAELSQVLRCSTSQAVARDGIELEMDTKTDWKPMEVPSNCRRDRIVFANFEDQTCSRVEDQLETVKEVRACPIEEAVCKIDACADEGVDQGFDGS